MTKLRLDHFAPALFVVLWSTGFVLARLVVGHIEPISFLAIRFTIAAVLMAGIAKAFGQTLGTTEDRLHAATAGFFLHAGYLAPIYWAVAHGLPGGVSALIVGLQPLMTVFLAQRFLGEMPNAKHWLAMLAGLIGVAMVLSPKFSWETIGGITPLTAGLGFLGAVSVTIGTVYQKRFASRLPLLASVCWQYVGAAAVVVVLAFFLEDFGFDASMEAWLGLAWSVLVLSVLSIILLLRLIRDGAVSRVSALIFLVPGCSALMTYFLFNEILTPIQIVGMCVTAAAVMIANRS